MASLLGISVDFFGGSGFSHFALSTAITTTIFLAQNWWRLSLATHFDLIRHKFMPSNEIAGASYGNPRSSRVRALQLLSGNFARFHSFRHHFVSKAITWYSFHWGGDGATSQVSSYFVTRRTIDMHVPYTPSHRELLCVCVCVYLSRDSCTSHSFAFTKCFPLETDTNCIPSN